MKQKKKKIFLERIHKQCFITDRVSLERKVLSMILSRLNVFLCALKSFKLRKITQRDSNSFGFSCEYPIVFIVFGVTSTNFDDSIRCFFQVTNEQIRRKTKENRCDKFAVLFLDTRNDKKKDVDKSNIFIEAIENFLREILFLNDLRHR